jgi:serine protease Do
MSISRFHPGALIVGLVLGVTLVTCAKPGPRSDAGPVSSLIHDAAAGLAPQPAFARADAGATISDVAERVVPSVVNLSATRTVRGRQTPHPFFDDPFFREFFGPRGRVPRDREQRSLGSGVIVSPDGVILTNNHVVENAEEVQVTLHDGRELEARLVGADPRSDLAVLRLEGEISGLTPLPFGDSSALRLGEVVLAIGNPFGVGQTVTMGIVSATGRSNVRLLDYEDFIQTDAAINPGNSGGALVNMRGELVGINTAILSRTGGYQGIGFAIPSEMAHPIMESLLADGKVVRGWLGVSIQDLDRELAAGLGLKVERGVLISDVTADSPAANAGLERGDVVLEANGERMQSTSRFRNLIAAAGPGTRVDLLILRDGKEMTVEAELGSLAESPEPQEEAAAGEGILEGLSVSALDTRTRARFEIPERIDQGVVVTGVTPGSPAAAAGLREGDVLLEVNRQRVDSPASFERLAKQAKRSILLLVFRDGATVYVSVSR